MVDHEPTIGRPKAGRPKKGDPPSGSHRRYVEVPKDLDAELQAIAEQEGLSIQASIRRAIASWVRHMGAKNQPR